MCVIVCVYRVKNKRERERRITQESYPGSPNPTTSSPHTSCEIIHYSIQLVETSNQHYNKVSITPDQSVTPILSTSVGFYNSLLSHKKGWNFSYLKLLSPIDLRSSLHFVGWMILDCDVSNKRDLYKYKLKKMFPIKEIKMINIVKDYGVCFVIVERDVEEIDRFFFERDRYQSFCISKLLHLTFIDVLYL